MGKIKQRYHERSNVILKSQVNDKTKELKPLLYDISPAQTCKKKGILGSETLSRLVTDSLVFFVQNDWTKNWACIYYYLSRFSKRKRRFQPAASLQK